MEDLILREYVKEINPEFESIKTWETKVWWMCSVNPKHMWQTSIRHRLKNGSGCPYCDGKKVLPEESLLVKYPDVAKQWDYDLNSISPDEIAPRSSKYVYWVCDVAQDHRWKAPVVRRTFHNTGCPYCSGHRTAPSTSIVATHPKIAAEWDFSKNDKKPCEVSRGCESKYYWLCDKGHSWRSTVNSRTTGAGTGCPFCISSRGEKAIKEILEKNGLSYIREYKFNDCKDKAMLRFDFAVFKDGKILTVIEFHGQQHYKPVGYWGGVQAFRRRQIRDSIKRKYCSDNRIPLIEISYKQEQNIENILLREIALLQTC